MVSIKLYSERILNLQFNIDGCSLYKSSTLEFLPMLCKIFIQPSVYKPFNVKTYCGPGKPYSVKKYFNKFLFELNHLLKDGIIICEEHFKINVMCFC